MQVVHTLHFIVHTMNTVLGIKDTPGIQIVKDHFDLPTQHASELFVLQVL